MGRFAPLDRYVAAGDACGDEKSPRLDPIRDHRHIGRMQLGNPLHPDDIRAGAGDLRSHGAQDIRQVDDLRLARGVLDFGDPVGETGGHQDVLRSAHGGDVEIDLRAPKPFCLGVYVAVPKFHFCAHLLQGLDMEIHGSRTDRAAPGQRYPGLPEPGHKRPQDENRGPHRLDEVIGGFAADRIPCVDTGYGSRFDLRAQVRQEFADGLDVQQIRDIVVGVPAVRQQRRHQNRQRGVLRAADADLAVQPAPPLDDHLVHALLLLSLPQGLRGSVTPQTRAADATLHRPP
ncbi:MAG: hypothetical protein A4E73_02047 [Syntrophaceae bacterium PtaU1.Bin231]|nr:MAG: hypothetical protein A4E73_02047 [Syntrophaceae bacterium PtaU1.Bin231]